MLKVNQLLKFVSDLNPQKTPTRLCFYNYLKGFHSPDDTLDEKVFDNFFNYCLDYPHWASNRQQIGHEIKFLLDNFNSFYQKPLDLSKIRFPQAIQVIELEYLPEWEMAAELFLKRLYHDQNVKIRILNDSQKKLIGLVLKNDRTLDVRIIEKKWTLRNGHLEPLRPDLAVFYDENLELSERHQHQFEIAPYITAQFEVENGQVSGKLIRGYVFQLFQEFKNTPLESLHRLQIPLKRIEQFFVDRNSDNFYQDLISQLERTTSLIQAGDSRAFDLGPTILNKAEAALEGVFVQDKLLSLLIRDLQHACKDFENKSTLIRHSPSEKKSDKSLTQSLFSEDDECLTEINLE